MTTEINEEVIEHMENLLCNALEGGSNYWYMIEDHNASEVGCTYLSDVPLKENGYLIFSDTEEQLEEKFKVDLNAMKKGWGVFKAKYPHHYNDLINENDDACTGDVFLQCVIFGEAIFG